MDKEEIKILITLLLQLADYIITPLLTIIGTIFEKLNIDEIMDPIIDGFDLLFNNTKGLLWLAFDLEMLRYLLLAVLGVETAFTLYKLTMWCIKKIPKFNVS